MTVPVGIEKWVEALTSPTTITVIVAAAGVFVSGFTYFFQRKQLKSRIAAAEARCGPEPTNNDEGSAHVLQMRMKEEDMAARGGCRRLGHCRFVSALRLPSSALH